MSKKKEVKAKQVPYETRDILLTQGKNEVIKLFTDNELLQNGEILDNYMRTVYSKYGNFRIHVGYVRGKHGG